MHRTIYNILLPLTGCHLIPFPPPQREYGRTLRYNQIFSDGWFTKFSYPWCFAGALRAPELRYNNKTKWNTEFKKLGLSAAAIGIGEEVEEDEKKGREGKCEIVFGSPESWLITKW